MKKRNVGILLLLANCLLLWVPFILMELLNMETIAWYTFPYMVSWVFIIVGTGIYSIMYLENRKY
jgi:hypothetical protein